MNLDGKRVLVTGSTGFIGSHLVERLVPATAHVRAFAHYNSRNDRGLLEQLPRATMENVEIVLGDLKDPDAVRRAVKGMDVVFHLGALIAIPYSYQNPMDFVQTNVVGTAHVLSACRDFEVERLVHTSTSETYGTAQYQPIDERHPLVGQSPYSASKIAADKLAESFHLSFGLPVATIRPFNTFGPRQSARAVIPTIIAQALGGDRIKLGSTTPKRDFTFVSDTVDGFVRVAACDAAIGQTINVGSGRSITIGEIVDRVAAICGRALGVVTDEDRIRPESSEVELLLADRSRAQTVLGWEPRVSFDDGLRATMEWMKSHIDLYKTTHYNV